MLKFYKTLKENYVLVSILFLATILRCYHVDFQSLWVDEINTMIQATPHQSLLDTYRSIWNNDLQPPLYFYILKYLFRLFGYKTFILRLFSALLGIAGVWAVYLLGRELANRKTGLYAALLLSVNYYHILYSQEGRPYAFLILFTILSFYYLCVFVKRPTTKNAIIYGLMSALMLYGHPIALFAFFSQYLIVIYYFFQGDKQQRRQLIYKGIVFTLVTILFYVPALPMLRSAARVGSFWIELPGPGIFSNILSQFFGGLEMLLALVYILLIYFFTRMFEQKQQETVSLPNKEVDSKTVFIILIPWLVCCTLIPFIRSYIAVPMIIARYMNVILPVIILFLAIAIYQINSKTIRFTILGLFVIFSFTDLFVVKDFYHKQTKTDFRGIATTVIKRLKPTDALVSRVGWHYSYFFDNAKPRYPIIWTTLEAYADSMAKDKKKITPGFWFLDAQDAPINLNPDASAFLYSHYFVDYKKELHQAIGIHFINKRGNYRALIFPTYPTIDGTLNSYAELEPNKGIKSAEVILEKGKHSILISSGCLPKKRLNNINAHITIKLNDKIIGGLFTDETATVSTKKITFNITEQKTCVFEFVFDNGFVSGNEQRKAFMYSAHLIAD